MKYPPSSGSCPSAGIIIFSLSRRERLHIFIDYQNCYRIARRAFGFESSAGTLGQFNPLALSELILKRRAPLISFPNPASSEIQAISIYSGIPSNQHDPKGFNRCRRQFDSWRKLDERIHVISRELRYPKANQSGSARPLPQEKGIDIALAIDFVSEAMSGAMDVGVLFSADSDFKPLVSLIKNRHLPVVVEVAAWKSDSFVRTGKKTYNQRLSSDENPKLPFCHWLDAEDFASIRDSRDYAISLRRI